MLVGLAEGLSGGIPCSLGQDHESCDGPGKYKQEEACVDTIRGVVLSFVFLHQMLDG